jgi:hypothetical protein
MAVAYTWEPLQLGQPGEVSNDSSSRIKHGLDVLCRVLTSLSSLLFRLTQKSITTSFDVAAGM